MKKILMALMLCLVSICGFGQFYGTCPGNETVTDVEGNVYNTIQIGNTCWMREDLRWANPVKYSMKSMSGSYNEQVYLFGLKYPFTKSDICPTGWKLPTHDDWNNLPVTDSIMSRCTDEYLSLVCGKWTSYGWTSTEYMVDSKPYYAMRVYSDRDSSLYDEVFAISMNTTGSTSTSYQHISNREFNQSGYFYGLTNGNDIKKGYQVRCIKDTSYTPEVTQPGTIYIHDTITITDTITIHDTVFVTDTLWLHDTITVTDTIYIYIDTTNTGIHEWGKSIKAYPNPTTGQLYLEGDFRQVSVWDMNGKCLQVTDEKILNFETLSSGVYILRIITVEGNVVVKKIIKQ